MMLPKKWTLRARGKQVVFVKHRNEAPEQVVMRALLWALYLPLYPDLGVELTVEQRYRPDVVSLNLQGRPSFWGHAGDMSIRQIRDMAKRYRDAHLALACWAEDLDRFEGRVRKALRKVKRDAPVDVISFPEDSLERFVSPEGTLFVSRDDVAWVRL